jgi:hypothetical protein
MTGLTFIFLGHLRPHSRTASQAAAAAVPRGLPDPATAPQRVGSCTAAVWCATPLGWPVVLGPSLRKCSSSAPLGHQSHVHVREEDDQGTRRVNYEFAIYCIISTV